MAEPQTNPEVSAAIVKYAIVESAVIGLGLVFYFVLESVWPIFVSAAVAPILFALLVMPAMMRNRSNDKQ